MVKWWVVGLWVEYKNPSWPPSHKVYTVHSGEHTVLTLPPQVITAHIKSFSLIVQGPCPRPPGKLAQRQVVANSFPLGCILRDSAFFDYWNYRLLFKDLKSDNLRIPSLTKIFLGLAGGSSKGTGAGKFQLQFKQEKFLSLGLNSHVTV